MTQPRSESQLRAQLVASDPTTELTRFFRAMKGTPVILFEQDAELRYTWVFNSELVSEPSEALGKTDYDLFAPSDAERVSAVKRAVLATGVPSRTELRVDWEGTSRYYHLSVGPIRDTAGAIVGVTCAATNVTDHAELERAFVEQQTRKEQQVACELHDTVAQELMGIQLLARSLTGRLAATHAAESAQVQELVELLQHAREHIRRIIAGLRPVDLDPSGFSAALDEMATWATRVFGVPCTFSASGTIAVGDAVIATQAYYIAREAVTNAARHAVASRIAIDATASEGFLTLAVRDDGRGMDARGDGTRGMGLRIMRHRAAMIRADLEFGASAEGGVAVVCTIPCATPGLGGGRR